MVGAYEVASQLQVTISVLITALSGVPTHGLSDTPSWVVQAGAGEARGTCGPIGPQHPHTPAYLPQVSLSMQHPHV